MTTAIILATFICHDKHVALIKKDTLQNNKTTCVQI